MLGRSEPHFSLAGLKTALRHEALARAPLSEQDVADLCASFQEAVADIVSDRTSRAIDIYVERHAGKEAQRALVVAGGVAANRRLKAALEDGRAQARLPPGRAAAGALHRQCGDDRLGRRRCGLRAAWSTILRRRPARAGRSTPTRRPRSAPASRPDALGHCSNLASSRRKPGPGQSACTGSWIPAFAGMTSHRSTSCMTSCGEIAGIGMALQSVGIVGAGAWGTALAVTSRRAGRDVLIWAYEPETARRHQQNASQRHLPAGRQARPGDRGDRAVQRGRHLRPPADGDAGAACCARSPASSRPYVQGRAAARDLLQGHRAGDRQADVAGRGRGAARAREIAVLSGPSFAAEVARGLPAAVTLATRRGSARARARRTRSAIRRSAAIGATT